MPEEFIEFIENVRQCGFEERPDYQGLRTMLRDLFYKMGFEYDYEFDWVLLRRQHLIEGRNVVKSKSSVSQTP
jgi:hypothetical protein